MQRAHLINRIYVRDAEYKKDFAYLDGFVDNNVFTCPSLKISIPLAHVAYIENSATKDDSIETVAVVDVVDLTKAPKLKKK